MSEELNKYNLTDESKLNILWQIVLEKIHSIETGDNEVWVNMNDPEDPAYVGARHLFTVREVEEK